MNPRIVDDNSHMEVPPAERGNYSTTICPRANINFSVAEKKAFRTASVFQIGASMFQSLEPRQRDGDDQHHAHADQRAADPVQFHSPCNRVRAER